MKTNTPFLIKFVDEKSHFPHLKNAVFTGLKINKINSITKSSLLSDERHILFYSQRENEDEYAYIELELNVMNCNTLECHTFTSTDLLKAKWPKPYAYSPKLAAWHSGLVLLYYGDKNENVKVQSFYINLEGPSIHPGPKLEIPQDFLNFNITAMSIDHHRIYIAFDSEPRKILVWKREQDTNTFITTLLVSTELASTETDDPQLTTITDIVIRRDHIAAVTSLGHIAMWDQLNLVHIAENIQIESNWNSKKVDSLHLGLEEGIGQISMSQDCKRIVILDPLWCSNPAVYITRSSETEMKKIPVSADRDSETTLFRIDEECRVAAVGIPAEGCGIETQPDGASDNNPVLTVTPVLTQYLVNTGKKEIEIPTFLRARLGHFVDFSIHRNFIIYYCTKGIMSIQLPEERDVTALQENIYTCSRNIAFNPNCWVSARNTRDYLHQKYLDS
ncbi:hypothetical protein QC760_010608 [Botrytis cinerea]